ncbi:hypothetical protein [Burkholderia ubonensis]|nr:hypothetical protein [Burkholderia ubonensis]
MVSSLIHLRTIGEELGRKDFVIPRMQAVMQDSIRAFDELTDAFDRAEEALQRDGQPYLLEWMRARSFSMGAELRFEGSSFGRQVARVRGGLSAIRLHKKLVDAKRYVVLTLEEPGFCASATGAFEPLAAFKADQLTPVLAGDRALIEMVKEGGRERQVARVLLPIKKADFDELARSPRYFRVV